eukprot:TCONS_00025708-protein
MLFSRKGIGFLFKTLIFLVITSILFGVWKEPSFQHLFRRQIKVTNQLAGHVDGGSTELQSAEHPDEGENEVQEDNIQTISKCAFNSLDVNQPRPNISSSQTTKCRSIIPTEEECLHAEYQYGVTKKTSPMFSTCRPFNNYQTIADLCRFKKENDRYRVICDVKPCNGGTIRIGFFQRETGFIKFSTADNYKAKSKLEKAIWSIYNVHKSKVNFCLLACFSDPNFIKQAVVFPPRLLKRKVGPKPPDHDNKININILLLDSVSRQHFYRKLPATAEAIREIKVTKESKIYDFEFFQSIAPRTFPNVRALFSGKVDIDANDEELDYHLENLTGYFRNLGYQNILQEDSCWFDVWGSLVTNNKHMENVSQNWKSIREKIDQLPIDSLGVSHLSCEAFQQYGKTNQFNNPPKVCYNGYLLPSYYLNLTFEYFREIESSPFRSTSKPVFMYTHLNTAHESTGKRVAQMDYLLAGYVRKMNALENTWTIILSDHGPKTTKYAQQHLAGRLEIGHAAMFLIVPRKVQDFLGVERLKALEINQKILSSHLDLHHALKTLYSKSAGGLLRLLPNNRFCGHVPMYSFMNCLCNGGTKIRTQSEPFHWIAEYVIGYLNELMTRSLLSAGTKNGYQNCERLIGSRFNKIREKEVLKDYRYFVMDVLVHKYRGEEIFEIVVRIRKISFTIEIVKWRRVSIYQHFSKCCDHAVDIQLCVCRKESLGAQNPGRDVSRQLSIASFGVTTESAFLDSKCLLLMKREKSNVFRTYEITNMCYDRIYHTNFTIDDKLNIRSTVSVPISTVVRPWFIHYITTISLDEENVNPQETIAFKIENL